MVKSLLNGLLLLCVSVTCFAVERTEINPEVKVVVDKSQVEMGKYLFLRIEYVGDSVPEISNLQKWYDDFFVDRREQEAEKLANGLIKYTEYLRLYPRRVGNMVLGAIAMGGAIAQPVRIKVNAAVRNGIDGTPHWLPLPSSIWQGQTIAVSIIQNSLHPSNQVVIEAGLFPGFYVQQLNDKTELQETIKTVQLRWLFTAQTTGLMQLEAPAIEQRGRGRWRFYLPRATIKVKPLPSYIPPTVPVGKLTIRTGVSQVDQKPVWTVELQNKGQLTEEIYGIRRQLSELTGTPVEVIKVSGYHPDKDNPMTAAHRYSVPVPDWSMGFINGPEITVQYFDVDEGRIKSVTGSLPGVWYVTRLWRNVLLLVFGLIVVIVSVIGFRTIKNIQAWRSYRHLLKQSTNPHELKRLLLEPGDFCTLDAWSVVKVDPMAKQITRKLNALCYSRSCHFSFNEIKKLIIGFHTFRRWLKHRA